MRISGVSALTVAALLGLATPARAQDEPAKPKPAPAIAGKAAAKPAAHGKAAPPKKHAPPKRARKPGEAGEPDEATRRIIAGASASGAKSTKESAELRAMRELDLTLFPPREGSAGAPFFAEGSPLVDAHDVRVSTSGLPPDRALDGIPEASAPQDLTWLKKLEMPDIPVRWDARVVRYLEYYKSTARGRGMVRDWIKKSGRYGAAVRRTLREQGVPEDILWLALVESGFDASISSPAGAAGLWQFMPDGAKIYGLTVDRWIDERLDPERSTVAAARYLKDLKQRFGNWELAFAAYNMGYGGLLAAIRKYNTNDFWELSRLESGVPLETALYVPKIVAMAIVARNRAIFGCADVELEPSMSYDHIAIGPGVSMKSVASAADVAVDRVEAMNPQVVAGRTPPDAPSAKQQATWTVRVPAGTGARAANELVKAVSVEAKLARWRVRWGESLDDIAQARRTTRGTLLSLNGIRHDEVIRPGTVIFVPAAGSADATEVVESTTKPTVVVPAQTFAYPDRHRAFYRVVPGDTVRDVSNAIGVTADELCRWNALDPAAQLHDGMKLQVFVPKGKKLDGVALLSESDARVLPVGSNEFFAYFEAQRGRKRVEVTAKDGDTWKTVARRYNLSLGQLERINQRARSSTLTPGDKLVVYVPADKGQGPAVTTDKSDEAVSVVKSIGESDPPKAEDKTDPAILRAAPDATP